MTPPETKAGDADELLAIVAANAHHETMQHAEVSKWLERVLAASHAGLEAKVKAAHDALRDRERGELAALAELDEARAKVADLERRLAAAESDRDTAQFDLRTVLTQKHNAEADRGAARARVRALEATINCTLSLADGECGCALCGDHARTMESVVAGFIHPPAPAQPVRDPDGFFKCEFCGCMTNAHLRRCCDLGTDADRKRSELERATGQGQEMGALPPPLPKAPSHE